MGNAASIITGLPSSAISDLGALGEVGAKHALDPLDPTWTPQTGGNLSDTRPLVTPQGGFNQGSWNEFQGAGAGSAAYDLFKAGNAVGDIVAPMIAGGAYFGGMGAGAGGGGDALDAAIAGNAGSWGYDASGLSSGLTGSMDPLASEFGAGGDVPSGTYPMDSLGSPDAPYNFTSTDSSLLNAMNSGVMPQIGSGEQAINAASLLPESPQSLGGAGGIGFKDVMSGLSAAEGLYGLYESNKMKKMAQQAGQPTPLQNESQNALLQQIQSGNLLQNPTAQNVTSLSGYQSGMDAVQRSMAAQGYQGSGNMMAAMQQYGGQFYQQALQNYQNQQKNLMSMGSSASSPNNYAQQAQMMQLGNQMTGQSLGNINQAAMLYNKGFNPGTSNSGSSDSSSYWGG